jgi:hypothetical protein
MFNMNLVRTPTNNDAEDLRQEYPQLEAHRPPKAKKVANKAAPSKAKKPAPKESKSATVKKAEPPKPVQATKPKKTHHDSEDESSEDDVLTIEDPGGAAPTINRDFSPGFIDKPRRFSEFVQQQNEEEEEEEDDEVEIEVEAMDDADGEEEEEEEEYEDDVIETFKLPSPINQQLMGQSGNGGRGSSIMGTASQNSLVDQQEDEDEVEEMQDIGGGGAAIGHDDMALDEMDLEAELMAELEKDESDVSEEE